MSILLDSDWPTLLDSDWPMSTFGVQEMSILRGDDERASEDYIEELIGMDV